MKSFMPNNLLLAMLLSITSQAMASNHAHWEYSGDKGPENWGALSDEFSVCASGKNQSPVNLTRMVEGELPELLMQYRAGGHEVVNNGHTVQINYAAGDSITVNGKKFELKQFHFHAPSENTIEGKSFPMEAHFVHADKAGNLAVLAVMFEQGRPSAELEKAWSNMPQKAGNKVSLGNKVDANALLPQDHAYYRFNGSLTTPPCSEGVSWFVMKQSVEASKDQIAKFSRTMSHANNRPVQPLNARMVIK